MRSTLAQLKLEMQPCAFCASESFEHLSRYDRHLLGLQTVGCKVCGLLQTNPRPPKDALDNFYKKHYRSLYQGVSKPSDEYLSAYNKDVRLRYTAGFLLSQLSLSPHCRLLDYGCSEGALFQALRQLGFQGQLFGVEPNDTFANYASERGKAIVLRSVGIEHAFDVIVINHVLEHVPDPLELLSQLRKSLRPGGKLYIDVPDAERYKDIGNFHIAHLFHFTERTLKSLVEVAGLAVDLCEKHSPPYHPPSLRLIASSALNKSFHERTTAEGESQVWALFRAIDANGWKWVIRTRLSRIAPLRTVYRGIRRLASRRPRASSTSATNHDHII
jgi:2-polyprenyl-3-methyl-5-hydroxy-6-metoxy-1,4-benzoquinol methylase